MNELKTLVNYYNDMQKMRMSFDNRIKLKKDGTQQKVTEDYAISEGADSFFNDQRSLFVNAEKEIEKKIKKELKKYDIYNCFLKDVKGLGWTMASIIIASYDIHKATTVSKMWQYTGYNPMMVRGTKRIKDEKGNYSFIKTDTMVRGDKLTPGFVSPFNKWLRTKMFVLAECFIKSKSPYREFYDNMKQRLSNSEQMTKEVGKGGKIKECMWKDCKKNHIHYASIRYMMKMFLRDLYSVWRTIEGLPVRVPYEEEYLGKKHSA